MTQVQPHTQPQKPLNAPHTLHWEDGLSGSISMVSIVTEHAQTVLESEGMQICVLGRVRSYGQDYATDLSWLPGCLNNADYYSQLAGFFALIVLDKKQGHIRLISDHVGSVPLYLMQHHGECVISDSLKLLEPRWGQQQGQLSHQALFDYCFFHCIPSPRTLFTQVSRINPGAELLIDSQGKVAEKNCYSPAYRYSQASESELKAQCKQVIDDAVRRNIAPKSAAFLSGGLDSSTVAGMFAKYQPNAPTFSIGFDAKGYDETHYAQITAKRFSTQHYVHYLQPQEIVDNFVEVAGYFDQPFGNSSAMAAYVCAKIAKENGFDVMLAGDGGDEIFGGNERYAKQKVFERYDYVPSPLRSMLEVLLNSPLGKLPGFKKGLSYVQQASIPLPDRLDTYNFLNRFNLESIFSGEFLNTVDVELPKQAKRQRYQQCQADHPVERMMYLDWKFTLADNDLVKVSRMCQKAGVEVRYPLFEKEVVDFSCTVPAEIKLPGDKLRHFYKESFRGFLADETLEKSKHGFGLPFGVWMKEQPVLRELTNSALAGLKKRNIFQPSFIEQALQVYDSGHANYYGELIWILVVLELWLQSRGL
ncbi:asparagine synthetase B family protein [Bowmanella denitrificans]|uniref:asparagine synthetase B family protein n=1 Tax=Bowmanella denitrificans TaxID=366582 RepID=UPI001FE96999|nr:asparagine synthase C-terminal domain-containing protein [Bowmanella denitrificans]